MGSSVIFNIKRGWVYLCWEYISLVTPVETCCLLLQIRCRTEVSTSQALSSVREEPLIHMITEKSESG